MFQFSTRIQEKKAIPLKILSLEIDWKLEIDH